MTFGDRIVGAMKLDPNTFEDIERDPTAMGQAVGVIALAAVSLGVGNIWYGGITGILFGICTSLIGYGFWAVVVSFEQPRLTLEACGPLADVD